MINIHCHNSMCQFREPHTLQGRDCYSNTPSKSNICTIDLDNTIINTYTDCYIDDCNGEYTICNTTQNLLNSSNESSPRCRELSSGGQTAHSNEQPINCTVSFASNSVIYLRCQKGECNYTTRSTNTTCSKDLGIDCEGEQKIIALTQLLYKVTIQYRLYA